MQIETSLINSTGQRGIPEAALRFLWGLLFLILAFPLCLVKYLGSLRYFAILGFAFPIYFALFLVAEHTTLLEHCTSSPSLEGLIFTVPVIFFATTCQPNIGDIYQDLRHKERNGPLVLITALGTIFVLYFVVGLFGCMHFQHVAVNMLNDERFPSEPASHSVRVT